MSHLNGWLKKSFFKTYENALRYEKERFKNYMLSAEPADNI